ncbi:MAG: hypothetical protein IPL49_05695 [Saprospirales bacterium]|nr:hypothetical protein [Saprospirales bacterium]MBK8490401.1 hypothetical protein [Saprospirales bacterium]
MKKIAFFLLAALLTLRVAGQSQADAFIKEAQDYLAKKEYKQAQLSLQDAINDINRMLANQVAETLPTEINGLKADGEGDINAGGMGMMGGGMQITQRYRNETREENEAEVQILANSPMLSAMSMYLTNPSILGPEYKSVRVGTIRAILKTEMQDSYDSESGAAKKIRSTEIQIPLGQTLITIQASGFATEQDELAFATKLDLEKIRTALGE